MQSIPLHPPCTEWSWWEDGDSLNSHFQPGCPEKKRKIKQPYNTASTMQLTRREASSLGHVSTEETSSPRSNWKCEIWRERWGGEKNRRTNINDLPTWVMTHCTLCSSSWTDISSSLSQHSISGCGSHPLSSPSLSPLSLSLSLRCHASSPHPSVRDNLPSDGSVIQFSPLSFFFFFFTPFFPFFAAYCFFISCFFFFLYPASSVQIQTITKPEDDNVKPLPASQQNSNI